MESLTALTCVESFRQCGIGRVLVFPFLSDGWLGSGRDETGWVCDPNDGDRMMCIFVIIIPIFHGKLHDNGSCFSSSKIYTRHLDVDPHTFTHTRTHTYGGSYDTHSGRHNGKMYLIPQQNCFISNSILLYGGGAVVDDIVCDVNAAV